MTAISFIHSSRNNVGIFFALFIVYWDKEND
jgi:hypothetical protein